MPPKVWDKPGTQRRDRPQNGTSHSRRPEKNHLKAWEAPLPEEEFGITSWMKSHDSIDKKKTDEDELIQIRQYGLGTCPSIENSVLFVRESLHERFGMSCQFTDAETDSQTGESPPVEDKANEETFSDERPQSESVKSGSRQSLTPAKVESVSPVSVPKRVCKSAIPLQYTHTHTPEEQEVQDETVDTVSLPVRSASTIDQSRDTSSNAVELPESKAKVKKLIGIAQKYMTKSDTAQDASDAGNDEASDTRDSNSEDWPRTDVAEDSRQIEDALLARERYLSETYDTDQPSYHNTFQWVRDPGGVSPGRIIKLSYSQREKTMYSLGTDRSDAVGRAFSRQNGGNIRGIMAASLSNLSPSSLNIRHFREGTINFLNYGSQGTARWGYENNSRGNFYHSENNAMESRQNSMVLKKVTIQDANADSVNSEHQESSEIECPESKRSEVTLGRDKSKVHLKRTSPQLTIDRTKIQASGSIPSHQHSRLMSGKVGRTHDPRDYVYSDSPSGSRIPIGDLLPAVEKSLQKTQTQKRTPRDQKDGESTGYSGLADKRETDAPIGPPAFLPLHTRSPLQRAKEIANKRLHGHVTQNPDGSETVTVPSPRYQSRSLQRRVGSAAGNIVVRLALFGSNTKLQNRRSARSAFSRQSDQRSFQGQI